MGSVNADGNNHISAFSYDFRGNATYDGTISYTYDAESQLKSATNNGTTTTYAYDGSGRRVSKSNGKLYWYGSGGEILAETDASGNTLNEYIFFGGKRIAILPSGGSAEYYVEDLLGSSRLMTTNNGTVCYDADFDPYGGEHAYTNTCSQNYKFEGKERDTETGNDDFGARYYSNRFGRWLSADWSAVPAPVPYANLSNPQTLNLYAMVADDPETFADLDGHGADPTHDFNCSGGGQADTCTGGMFEKDENQSAQSGSLQHVDVTFEAKVGVAKELLNTVIDLLNAASEFWGSMSPSGSTPPQIPELQASNNAQAVGMATTSVALLIIPGGSEEKAAAKGGEVLTRLGSSAESAARLARKAEEAEKAIGIHGVSATAGSRTGEVSSAARSAVEKFFKVHDTPTAHDSLHRTIELLKPVTKEVADTFNRVFGRIP